MIFDNKEQWRNHYQKVTKTIYISKFYSFAATAANMGLLTTSNKREIELTNTIGNRTKDMTFQSVRILN